MLYGVRRLWKMRVRGGVEGVLLMFPFSALRGQGVRDAVGGLIFERGSVAALSVLCSGVGVGVMRSGSLMCQGRHFMVRGGGCLFSARRRDIDPAVSRFDGQDFSL